MSDRHPESEARMVDVTSKAVTAREAEASCVVRMQETTRSSVLQRDLPKGDALEVARIAGIMAAKKTPELIPLCHPLSLGSVEVSFSEVPDGIEVRAIVRTSDRTGVEMEALTAAGIAALTIYDMIKASEAGAVIGDLMLRRKSGGRSGNWER